MKKIIYILFAICLFSGCENAIDSTEMASKLDDLEFRLSVLEDRCRRINTNITALQTIIVKSPEKDRIVAVVPIVEEGINIGYNIDFAFGNSITVYCARDGKDGIDGVDGKDGKDGEVPQIGIVKEGNLSYWTVNGNFILDEQGQRIPLVVKGGSEADGRTPLLKTENGAWFYSMDKGSTWTEIEVSIKYGDGNIFKSVTQTDTDVLFTLADGTVITIPKKSTVSLSLSLEQLTMQSSAKSEVNYSLTGSDSGTVVDAFAQGNWKTEVVASSATEGKIIIYAPENAKPSSVVVFATSSLGLSVYKTIKINVE